MSELLDLITIEETEEIIEEELNLDLETEIINIREASGRVVAENIISKIDLPPFRRSTMDGYAVKAKDTFGATDNLPVYCDLVGEVKMGYRAQQELEAGAAIKIPTGGMLPPGADAVVMIEYTEVAAGMVEITSAVAAGENIVQQGEDISRGERLLQQGQKLRSQDIGALAGIGVTEIEVFRLSEVTIFATGDEIVAPDVTPELAQVRDINSYSIGSLVEQLGARVDYGGIIADKHEELMANLEDKLATSDLVILSGGSSVGVKDLTIEVLNQLGEPGVLAHGVAIKPGKPTILALIDQTLVVGLPGHPASALVVATRMVAPLIRQLVGRTEQEFATKIVAKLSRNLASTKGREEYLKVSLEETEDGLLAKPIVGKSSLITTLVKADGLVEVGLGCEGVVAGTEVEVLTF
jgi:molybdopterin molybdotransferase